jgi:hypothetical protein
MFKGEEMSYQVSEEEANKWTKEEWTTKGRGSQPIDTLPNSYAKNIVKYIERRYNDMHKEQYIENSALWLALCRKTGTDPADLYNRPDRKVSSVNSKEDTQIDNRSADKELLLKLISDEVKGIDSGNISLKEARNFIAGLQIKLNTLL